MRSVEKKRFVALKWGFEWVVGTVGGTHLTLPGIAVGHATRNRKGGREMDTATSLSAVTVRDWCLGKFAESGFSEGVYVGVKPYFEVSSLFTLYSTKDMYLGGYTEYT